MILSDTLARHRKPPRSSAAGSGKPSRRGKLSAIVSPFRHPVRVAAVVVVGLAALVAAWPAAYHWMARESNPTWVQEADALGLQMAGSLGLQVREQPEVVSEGVAVAPIYLNPLRNVNGLVLERVDQGVDFNGTGPVTAVGDGIVTSAAGDAGGWPGGGWITYQLTNGPGQGLIVYVAEDVTPEVQVGQSVTPSTVLGYMFEGGDGIETGWAALNGLATSELSEASATGDSFAFPTASGTNFDELLQSLGVPPAPNFGEPASGYLPSNYPTSW